MRASSHQSGGSSLFKYFVVVICVVTLAGVYNLLGSRPSLPSRTREPSNEEGNSITNNFSGLRSSSSPPSSSLPKVTDEVLPSTKPKVWFKKDRPDLNYAPELPVTYKCSKPILWGTDHHGGWYICGDPDMIGEDPLGNVPTDNCLVYSYGLGADWSFDNAAEAHGCEVHGFDPTGELWRQGMHGTDYANIDYTKQYPSTKKFFHNWGLGAASRAEYPAGSVPQDWPGLGDPQLSKSNPETWELRSISQTMEDLGHKKLTVLKIDVEGAEWDALASFLANPHMMELVAIGNFKQLLLEFHWDPDSRAKNERHWNIMKRIEEIGFKPWMVNRHEGSDCCLDVSYVWSTESGSINSNSKLDTTASSTGHNAPLGMGSASGLKYDKNGKGLPDSESDDNFIINGKQ